MLRPDSPLHQIMNVKTASKLWECSTATVKNLCAMDQVEAVKLDGTWILDKNQAKPEPKKK